jgi:hypothetical protein
MLPADKNSLQVDYNAEKFERMLQLYKLAAIDLCDCRDKKKEVLTNTIFQSVFMQQAKYMIKSQLRCNGIQPRSLEQPYPGHRAS